MDSIRYAHLPRLEREYYKGLAVIHWTLTLEDRATGWLTDAFHQQWQLVVLHTCSRYELIIPAYVLMPDHIHVLLMGLEERGSNQPLAIEFLRSQLRRYLAPADWQHQPHDNVLREQGRNQSAVSTIALYLLQNPERAALVERWQDYRYLGFCIPGYPDLDIRSDEYWALFWRIYNRLIGASSESTRSRS